MNNKLITTIAPVLVDEVKKGKSSYKKMTVTFKDHSQGDKVSAKTLLSFATDKNVWDTFERAQIGARFNVVSEKGPNGYFEWVSVSPATDEAVANNQQVRTQMRSNFETPEERAMRQLYIIRQSSIASAVELVKDHGKQPDPKKVIEVARVFEEYVLGLDKPQAAPAEELPE